MMPLNRTPVLVRTALLGLLCVASSAVLARHHRAPSAQPGEPGQFDYYLLSLSWSPSYCLTHGDDRSQCGGKGYGFVLHGLWPQFESGGFPENCIADAPLPAVAQGIGKTLYPSTRLMQHEWQTHGTCSGMEAADYFRTEDRALAVVHIPPQLETPPASQSLTAGNITAQFLAANAGMNPDSLVVACSRGELSEVRVCLTRILSIRSCGARVRSTCSAAPVDIPSVR